MDISSCKHSWALLVWCEHASLGVCLLGHLLLIVVFALAAAVASVCFHEITLGPSVIHHPSPLCNMVGFNTAQRKRQTKMEGNCSPHPRSKPVLQLQDQSGRLQLLLVL